ncbi:MAG: sulfotransferase [Chloroflexota bacterium]
MTVAGAPPRRAADPGQALKLPTFLILGANKGGTTSLHRYLAGHPQVFLPEEKEPHWFAPSRNAGDDPHAVRDADWLLPDGARSRLWLADYAALFAGARPEQVALGEASTGYLTTRPVPERVHAVLPDARFVAILRDPAQRAWSEFLMMRRLGQEAGTDLAAIVRERPDTRYLQLSRYAAGLEEWFRWFPRERFHLVRFEDFVWDTARVVRDILGHIGVDPSVPLDTSENWNRGEGKVSLDPATHALLIEALRPDILRLQDLLGWQVPAWLEPGPELFPPPTWFPRHPARRTGRFAGLRRRSSGPAAAPRGRGSRDR